MTNDLEVPAEADFVIEGYVDPKEPLRTEGPFGDHTGYYSLADNIPPFTSPPLPIAETPFIPRPSWACRRWRIFTSAPPASAVPARLKNEFSGTGRSGVAGRGRVPQPCLCQHQENLSMQAYKIMHGLWGMGQMMFTKYIVVRGRRC